MIDTKALRQKILDMAIKGKLVPQDPNDEPASVLLERIRAEKQQLIKEGKIKKDKNDSVIFKGDDNRYYEKIGSEVKDITDEVPFEIPDSWAWVKLPQIAQIELGKTLNKNTDEGEDVQYLCSLNVQWEGIKLDFVKRAKFTTNEQEKYRLRKNDLLICEGGEAGRSSVWNHNDIMYYQNALHRARFIKGINAYFFKAVFDRYSTMGLISKYCVGVTIKHLTSSALNAIFFPMPPLFEQQRIMSRVEELFDQIAAIEQNQSNIDTLYEEFKKRTLTLAIQGKLVPQDPNDEPASVLLERIRAEKKAKLGKKYVDSYIYKGDDNCYYEHIAGKAQDELVEVPFDIPDNWAFTRLDTIIGLSSGTNLTSATMAKSEQIYPVFGGNGITGYYDKYNIGADHIIIGRVGFYCGSIHVTNKKSWITDNALIVSFDNSSISTSFFALLLESLELGKKSSATAQPLVTGKIIKPIIVALPPLAEQNRIVAKINEIFAML